MDEGPLPIQIATMLLTSALAADRQAVEDEVVRVISETPAAAGETMMHLITLATGALRAAAKMEGGDPNEFLQRYVVVWIRERDEFLRRDQSGGADSS
jgi:hypothetical protein